MLTAMPRRQNIAEQSTIYILGTGGKYRLCRKGDEVHSSRTDAPHYPSKADVPAEYIELYRRR